MARPLNRRDFLAGSASLIALIGALQARAAAGVPTSRHVPGPYGPLRPARDLATGLPLILLPEGFQYRSFSWAGDPMADGSPTPDRHDGMGVVAVRGRGTARELVLVRNHERSLGSPIDAPQVYDRPAQGPAPGGGTTTLRFRGREWRDTHPSLGGTLFNCAGGVTPWGTWLSCEETVTDLTSRGGRRHGYVFEVRPSATPGEQREQAQPIVAMGRMRHEAVAIDPRTRIAYLSEDEIEALCSGFYRYIPKDASGKPGSYHAGGRLQAAKVAGRENADLRRPQVGDTHRIEWVDIPEPDADPETSPVQTRDKPTRASGPFLQAFARGALWMSRLEGICFHGGKVFLVDTVAGTDEAGRVGHGEGAVWEYDPARATLRALFVAGTQRVGDNIDNVTGDPRGGLILCEDGDRGEDGYPTGTRLLGLTPEGDAYTFAKNAVTLSDEDIARAGKRVPPGDYRAEEWAGCCFDPAGEVLFANLQVPGITLAIWGPWRRAPRRRRA